MAPIPPLGMTTESDRPPFFFLRDPTRNRRFILAPGVLDFLTEPLAGAVSGVVVEPSVAVLMDPEPPDFLRMNGAMVPMADVRLC